MDANGEYTGQWARPARPAWPSITTTHFLQDTGCVAFPFVDVHPQTIAATLAVSSVPEAVTQAVVVILEVWPESHWPGFALRQADVLQS